MALCSGQSQLRGQLPRGHWTARGYWFEVLPTPWTRTDDIQFFMAYEHTMNAHVHEVLMGLWDYILLKFINLENGAWETVKTLCPVTTIFTDTVTYLIPTMNESYKIALSSTLTENEWSMHYKLWQWESSWPKFLWWIADKCLKIINVLWWFSLM